MTDSLYADGLISFVEYDKLTQLKRQTFSSMYVDLFPKLLEKNMQKEVICHTNKEKDLVILLLTQSKALLVENRFCLFDF